MAKRANGEGTISKRIDGTWEGKISLGYDGNGKRKRKTVYGKTRQEVREKLDEVKQQLANGTFSDTRLTVKRYLEQWVEEKARQVKPRTAEMNRYYLQKHIIPHIGGIQLTKLTPLEIQAMCSSIASTSGNRTANLCRTTLHTALKQALRWGLIPRNPVEAVDAFKETRKEMTLWTPEEVIRFLDTARTHRLYPFFYLALSTGMRRGELLGLRWQDIKGSTVNVHQSLTVIGGQIAISEPKTEKGKRRVAISQDALDVLEAHRHQQDRERNAIDTAYAENDLIFRTEVGTPIHPRNLERSWYMLQRKAKEAWIQVATEAHDTATLKALEENMLLPHIRLHDLRHLHASLSIKQGMDAKLLADRLGHSRASLTLDIYTHLFEDQKAKSALSLSTLLGSEKPKN